jgi:SAM-dependent methyltransferase
MQVETTDMEPSQCDTCGTSLHMLYPGVVDPQTRESFAILRCPACDVGRTEPVPADLGRYYGAAYHGGRHGITERHCMQRRLGFVTSRGAPGRLLDFGCGDGGFMLHAKAAGWETLGVEMKPDDPRSRGLAVVETLDDVNGSFDAITLWHSLEHVRSPRETLEALSRHLAPGGHLFVAVPNRRSLQARVFGSRWFHLDVPRHVSHFSPRALAKLFRMTGYEPVQQWNLEAEIDWFGWPQSMLNLLFPPNILFDVATGRPRQHPRALVATNIVLGAALTALSAPLVPLAAAAGRGAIVVMAARRAG